MAGLRRWFYWHSHILASSPAYRVRTEKLRWHGSSCAPRRELLVYSLNTPRQRLSWSHPDWQARLVTTSKGDDGDFGRGRRSLASLVIWGTVVVSAFGGATFAWLAWLLSRQAAPWHDPGGWWRWIDSVDGPSLFDSARTTVTLLAVVGVGGAALVTYRRQDTAERTHEVAFRSGLTAAKQLELDSDKYQLDRDRHQLEVQRRNDERERELRTRFTTVAEQLGSTNFSVRHAGAYALASLADDWHHFGNDSERQVCVDLLCAQLRSVRASEEGVTDEENAASRGEFEIRKTFLALIRSRRPIAADGGHAWNSCTLDLSGADLSGVLLDEINLQGANLDNVDLSHSVLVRVNLTDARMRRAMLTGAEFNQCDMRRVRLRRSQIDSGQNAAAVELGGNDLTDADFVAASLGEVQFPRSNLTNAKFSGAHLQGSNFSDATLTGAWFYGAKLSGANFRRADIRGALFGRKPEFSAQMRHRVDLSGVDFEGTIYDETTTWPDGVKPSGLPPTTL